MLSEVPVFVGDPVEKECEWGNNNKLESEFLWSGNKRESQTGGERGCRTGGPRDNESISSGTCDVE